MTNLTHLWYFKVAAETENLTKAAEILYISQPALSIAISKLEKELGVTLFNRSKGRITLSKFGQEYYSCVAQAFSILDQGEERIRDLLIPDKLSITVVSPMGGILEPLSTQFLKQTTKKIQINHIVLQQEKVYTFLTSGAADFAITPVYMTENDIQQDILMDDEVFLVAGHRHPVAQKNRVTIMDLEKENFLINETSFDQYIIANCCSEYGFLPKIIIHSNESGALLNALLDGVGISLIPASVLCSQCRHILDKLCVLRLEGTRIFRMISIAKRKNIAFPAHIQKMYDFTVQYLSEMSEESTQFIQEYLPPVSGETRIMDFTKRPIESTEEEPLESNAKTKAREAYMRRSKKMGY